MLSIDLYEASAVALPPAAELDRARDRPIPWPEFCREFLELYAPSVRARTTRAKIEQVLRILAEIGVTSTAELTLNTVVRFVGSRPPGQSPHTTRSLLRCVQAACNHAQACGYLKVSPFAIRKLRSFCRPGAPKGKEHLTKEEIRRILDVLAADVDIRLGHAGWSARRLQALVALVAYTGLRRGEALWLQVQDIDLDNHVLFVVDRASHRLKTERACQPVALPAELIPVLASWISHRDDSPPGLVRPPSVYLFRQWTRTTPWTGGCNGYKPLDRLHAIGERAGVKGATFQALRKSVATHLEDRAAPSMIQRILRHTSVQTSEKHYRRADLANMRQTMDGFSYASQPGT